MTATPSSHRIYASRIGYSSEDFAGLEDAEHGSSPDLLPLENLSVLCQNGLRAPVGIQDVLENTHSSLVTMPPLRRGANQTHRPTIRSTSGERPEAHLLHSKKYTDHFLSYLSSFYPSKADEKFDQLVKRIRGFASLDSGWDSYDSEAPSATAIKAALQLVAALRPLEILPDWVVPTSDSSILLQFHHNETRYKWEFDSDGDIGVMLQPLFDQPQFNDLAAEDISSFVSEHLTRAS